MVPLPLSKNGFFFVSNTNLSPLSVMSKDSFNVSLSKDLIDIKYFQALFHRFALKVIYTSETAVDSGH